MKAADVMSTRVITVPQDMPVRQVARILLDHRISAVPVVGLDGRVVGMISESDLIRRDSTARPGSWWLRLIAEPGDYNLAQDRVAADVMSRDVVSVAEDTPLAQIADLLERKRIKRVPVFRDDRLVGIVSRANLLHGLATYSAAEQPASEDRSVREDVMTAIGRDARIDDMFVNVTVTNGTVHLWGLVDSEKDRQAALSAAEKAVGGSHAIKDHLGITPPYLRSMMWT